jgi:hypothetical protein
MAPHLDGPAAIFGSLPARCSPAGGSGKAAGSPCTQRLRIVGGHDEAIHGHPGDRSLHTGAGPPILRGERHQMERAGITGDGNDEMIVRA